MDQSIFKASRAAITKSTPDNVPAINTTAPIAQLTLKHVAGFNKVDGTKLLFFGASESSLLYPAAALGIVHYIGKQQNQAFFSGHTDDCCAVTYNRDVNLAASGQVGAMPVVYVWKPLKDASSSTNIDSLATLSMGKGFMGVAAISISGDGKYVLAAAQDTDHTLFVWDWSNKSSLLLKLGSGKTVITDLVFNPIQNGTMYEFMSIGEKSVRVWTLDIQSKKLTSKTGIYDGKIEQQPNTSVAYLVQEKLYVTGTATGDVIVWESNAKECKVTKCFKDVHLGKVFGVSALKDGGFVSGGGSSVQVYDSQLNVKGKPNTLVQDGGKVQCMDVLGHKLAVMFDNGSLGIWCMEHNRLNLCVKCHIGGTSKEVWGLDVLDNKQIATCGDDKQLIVWETHPNLSVSKQANLPHPGRCIGYNPLKKTLAVGLHSGQVAVYNATDLKQVHQITVSKSNKPVSVIKYAPQGDRLAVGTHDSSIYIIMGDIVTSVLPAHTSFVSALDWSMDGTMIQSNSGDYELLFSTVSQDGIGKQDPNASNVKNVQWSTYTCKIGYATAGMWTNGLGMDGSDINACDSDSGQGLLVLGTDLSKVELMRFPALAHSTSNKSAPLGRKTYTGHAAHVTNVRFSMDGKSVYSTGGKDGCLMVWTVSK